MLLARYSDSKRYGGNALKCFSTEVVNNSSSYILIPFSFNLMCLSVEYPCAVLGSVLGSQGKIDVMDDPSYDLKKKNSA